MKKLLILLLFIGLFFVACEEEDIKPFEGTWSGTYSGGDSGTWEMVVNYYPQDAVGAVTGTTTSSNGGSTGIFGGLNSDGTISAGFVDESLTSIGGTEWVGKFEQNDASGTWQDGEFIEGTWTGKKK